MFIMLHESCDHDLALRQGSRYCKSQLSLCDFVSNRTVAQEEISGSNLVYSLYLMLAAVCATS